MRLHACSNNGIASPRSKVAPIFTGTAIRTVFSNEKQLLSVRSPLRVAASVPGDLHLVAGRWKALHVDL